MLSLVGREHCVAVLGAAWLVVGCGTPQGATEDVPLIDAFSWQTAGQDLDPFADHRPAVIECTGDGFKEEAGGIEIETGRCNYLLVEQPLLTDIAPGDPVSLSMWHQRLAYPEPATGHVAVAVAGEVLWEVEIAIPGEANVYEIELESPLEAVAGDPVVLHLHNHGYNTWVFQSLLLDGSP